MLRQRRQHPEVGERYSWECTGDGPAGGAPPPRPRTAIETLADCKSTSTTSVHLHRFSDSSPRMDDDGELTEKEMEAAEADAVVRYSMMRMASIQSDRHRFLAVTEDYG